MKTGTESILRNVVLNKKNHDGTKRWIMSRSTLAVLIKINIDHQNLVTVFSVIVVNNKRESLYRS
jgi:hypothetical protein